MTDDCVPVPLAESDWLDRTVTDLDGRRGVVRRVYQVGAVQVAILTTADQSPDLCPIWDMPLDLLAREGQKAAFPAYRQQVSEVGRLEFLVLYGKASEAETSRYRSMRDRLAPYSQAQSSLHVALIGQIQAGDRVVDYLQNWHGTVLNPDPLPEMPFRHTMTVRLDEAHREERWPDGIVDLFTVTLYPTLGLL
ncbi:hypothetical protein OG413_44720 [Streptomyces sp. NBC_01433]|uniref:hypothetical protein n=1 Tax=Streptomyces sp. NBC_01433 TaxID=2903864 RepID=UPI00224D975A|nr:hypothetical protein [Streptomyces sp. NBC_01433]MCX4682289.1 hypothetical protein [Streptomyces sp. NBC_01433]